MPETGWPEQKPDTEEKYVGRELSAAENRGNIGTENPRLVHLRRAEGLLQGMERTSGLWSKDWNLLVSMLILSNRYYSFSESTSGYTERVEPRWYHQDPKT